MPPPRERFLASQADAFDALPAIGTISRFRRKDTIFREGDDALHLYKLVCGAVRLCKARRDGRRQVVEFFLRGDFFGFEWLNTCSLTAEALSDCTLVRYSRAQFEHLGEEGTDVRRRLTALVARDLWATRNHMLMLGRKSARERVALFVLSFAERQKARRGDTIGLPMGRQDIADYLGLTIETVCRAIGDLKHAGAIAVPSRRAMVLRDIDALRDAAEGGA